MINREPFIAPLSDSVEDDAKAARADEHSRQQDNLRWLEEHTDFRPLGYEW